MFKSAAVSIMLLCLSSAAWAQRPAPPKQEPKPPQQRPERSPKVVPVKDSTATVERLRKLFHLNGDQVFKLRPLVDERNRQLAQVQEQGGNAQSRKSDSDSIQQSFQTEFRAILTLDQAAQFDKEILIHPGSFR
jgi:hypothetical protein